MAAGYMDQRESAYESYGANQQQLLEVIAGRYIGANPAIPFRYRVFSRAGVLQNSEGMYLLDFTERYADAPLGSYVYMMGLVWSDEERSLDCAIEPLGPTGFYLNEEQLYQSAVIEELKPDGRVHVPVLLRKGWNSLLIESRKTPAGFGCRFGADEAKVRIMQVLAPFADRKGSAGWVFSEPVATPIFGAATGRHPDWHASEAASGLTFRPGFAWDAEHAALPNMARVLGAAAAREDAAAGGKAGAAAGFAYSSIDLPRGCAKLRISGKACGPSIVWIGGRLAGVTTAAGEFAWTLPVEADTGVLQGSQPVLVWSAQAPEGWGFALQVAASDSEPPSSPSSPSSPAPLPLRLPAQVLGSTESRWLYAGPLPNPLAHDHAPSEQDLQQLAQTLAPTAANLSLHDLIDGREGRVYWQVDAPDSYVRPYYENAMLSNKWTVGTMTNFARWDYPLGVTMYGLLRTSEVLKRQDIADYALRHIQSCTDWYTYSLWDYEQYGFPAINHQLVLLRMLDNCGSFGSAMLEAYGHMPDERFLQIADRIADFMLNKLERREDGAFYRTCEGEYSANTMWADDLYMSAPFLIRYARLRDKPEALDEAARQFLLFRKYLFIEDEGVMSHVYDFKYNLATRVPWGRGNGWVLFSLTELLAALPENHSLRPDLLTFFRELAAGIAALQSKSGLWRQVLNQPDAYEEASCTAMFVYGFARGVRYSWFEQPSAFAEAASKGWEGLARNAIDRQGNVHGVCSGSRYSFAPDYYMYDLRTVLNDNHGIGIMLLAGVEMELLRK